MRFFYRYIFKNFFDKLFAFIFLVLLSPLLFLFYILIYLFLGRPIFFKQKRIGFRCKQFNIIKFRTMKNIFDEDGKLLPEEQRLSKFGSWMRKNSIDELPELINIIKGEMSFTGPRPLLVEYLNLYNKEEIKRHNVIPGLTGWAQINGRNKISWKEKFSLDLWYLKKQNFLVDVFILIKTIFIIFKKDSINFNENKTMPKFNGKN